MKHVLCAICRTSCPITNDLNLKDLGWKCAEKITDNSDFKPWGWICKECVQLVNKGLLYNFKICDHQ